MSFVKFAMGVIAAGALMAGSAKAQTGTIQFNGGNSTLAGTLGATIFTSAFWEVNAIFNPVPLRSVGTGLEFAVNSATLTLTEGATVQTVDWLAPSGGTLRLFADTTNLPNIAFIAFNSGSFTTADLAGNATPPYVLNPLSYTGSVLGSGTFETSAGQFNYTSVDGSNSGFVVANFGGAVPEPGEWAAMGILGAGLAGLVIRKRRAA